MHHTTSVIEPQLTTSPSRHRAAPLTTEVIPAAEIRDSLRTQWQDLRSRSSAYRSSFFSPHFIDGVVQSNSGLQFEALVTRRGEQLTGVLPFQRVGKCGFPIGRGINDAHGLMCTDDLDYGAALPAAGLKSYIFHASPSQLPEVQKYELGREKSFLADLTADPKGYESFLRGHSDTVDRQGQKTRRLIRQKGPLRLDFDCQDPRLLDLLIELKCEQYRRTHIYPLLAVPWIKQLLHKQLLDRDRPVRGLLSVLYAGDDPVAMHYGMIEDNVIHYWFPTYDTQYSYGSPGTVLFLEIAKAAEQQGVTAIDMGYGEQAYKHKLTNVVTEMSFGIADTSPLRRALHRARVAWRAKLKQLKWKDLVKPYFRRLFPNFGSHKY